MLWLVLKDGWSLYDGYCRRGGTIGIVQRTMPNIFYKHGPYASTYYFESVEKLERWWVMVGALKREAVDIDMDRSNNTSSSTRCLEWLQSVLDFVKMWDESNLPPDIKVNVNLYEQDMGMPITRWSVSPEREQSSAYGLNDTF